MVSLTVQLDEQVAEVVSKLAAAQNRSESEVVQEAVAAYVQITHPMPQGVGRYHSGRGDVSENAENILRDAARQGQWP
jgi:metal-responsive CopG/Arc/MetJ family transcriptional regulator